jgi:hypothetical protein
MSQIYLVSKEEAKEQVLDWYSPFFFFTSFTLQSLVATRCPLIPVSLPLPRRIRRSFVHQEGQSIPRKEAHERYLAWYA